MTAFIIILAIFLAMEFSGRAKKAGMAQEYRSKLQKEKAIQEAQKENLEMMRKEYFKEASKYNYKQLYNLTAETQINYLKYLINENKKEKEELDRYGHLYSNISRLEYNWLVGFDSESDLVALATYLQGKKYLTNCRSYFKNQDWYLIPETYSEEFLKKWRERYPKSSNVENLEEYLKILVYVKRKLQDEHRYTQVYYPEKIILFLAEKYNLQIERRYKQNLYFLTWEYTQKQFEKINVDKK